MRTDELIAHLSDGLAPVRRGALARQTALGVGAGLLLSAVLMLAWMGLRADFDGDAGRGEILKVSREGVRSRPDATFGQAHAVGAHTAAVAETIAEVDANRDGPLPFFRNARQVGELRESTASGHVDTSSRTLYQVVHAFSSHLRSQRNPHSP